MKTITVKTLEAIKTANGKAIDVTSEFPELQNDKTAYFFDLEGNFLSDRLYKIRDEISGKSVIYVNLPAYADGTKDNNPEIVMASLLYFS